jgi:hypothetical protein
VTLAEPDALAGDVDDGDAANGRGGEHERGADA